MCIKNMWTLSTVVAANCMREKIHKKRRVYSFASCKQKIRCSMKT